MDEEVESFGDVAHDGIFTPLIDIFVAIVFFLMVGMTAGGEFVSVTSAVQLPRSTGAPASQELTVAISPDRIFLGGEEVVTVREAMTSAEASEPYLIPELYRSLEEVRAEVESTMGEDERFRGVVAIQGDRRIPYAVLSRVMYSARKAGFRAFNLHVQEGEATVLSDGGSSSATSGLLSSSR